MSGTITDASFDHRDVGTAAQEWSETGLIDNASTLDLAGLRRLIVVAAHPDDESLGAGGLIATAAGRGVPVTVIVATTGEASHPQSPTLLPAQLAPIRRAEVLAAVHRLAPQAVVVQLDLGDGRLAAAVDPLAGEIRSVIDGVVDGGMGVEGDVGAPETGSGWRRRGDTTGMPIMPPPRRPPSGSPPRPAAGCWSSRSGRGTGAGRRTSRSPTIHCWRSSCPKMSPGQRIWP